uniref:DH domain-containing protein n=1 Tax=Glossina austeni TaxID=7395 RepID=A0A1A9VU15_GLOAU
MDGIVDAGILLNDDESCALDIDTIHTKPAGFRRLLFCKHLLLQECQMRLDYKLWLAAYLLKSVQRIKKYQLLLKDLLRFSDNASYTKEIQKPLDGMFIQKNSLTTSKAEYSGSNLKHSCRRLKHNSIRGDIVTSHYFRPSNGISYSKFFSEDGFNDMFSCPEWPIQSRPLQIVECSYVCNGSSNTDVALCCYS